MRQFTRCPQQLGFVRSIADFKPCKKTSVLNVKKMTPSGFLATAPMRVSDNWSSSCLRASDHRIPLVAYDRLRRLIEAKQCQVEELRYRHNTTCSPLYLYQHFMAQRQSLKLSEKLRIFLDPKPMHENLRAQYEASMNPSFHDCVEESQSDAVLLKSLVSRGKSALPGTQGAKLNGDSPFARELLKRIREENSQEMRLSVSCDIKRVSTVTSKGNPERLNFQQAESVVLPLAEAGADVVFINTDKEAWGGSFDDLVNASRALKKAFSFQERPAIVMKDLILHPIQVAQAAEAGADGVYLMHCIAGAALEELLFSAFVAGIEALVEVHSPQEAKAAVAAGATLLVANQADRVSGLLYPGSAERIRDVIPSEAILLAKGGIVSCTQAKRLARCGIDGVVLGRALMQADAFDLLERLRRVMPGPRSLVHMFAQYESMADDITKLQDKEKELRKQRRKSENREMQSGDEVGQGSLAGQTTEAVVEEQKVNGQGDTEEDGIASTIAKVAEASLGILPEQHGHRSDHPSDASGDSSGTLASEDAHNSRCPSDEQSRLEDELKRLDDSLRTRVIRVCGSPLGAEKKGAKALPPQEGVTVFHSFSNGCTNFRNRSFARQDCVTQGEENALEEEAYCQGVAKYLIDKAGELDVDEQPVDSPSFRGIELNNETSKTPLKTDLPYTSLPKCSQAERAVGASADARPQKVCIRDASGVMHEYITDTDTTAVDHVDPQLIAKALAEAQRDPKAFEEKVQKRIEDLWRHADDMDWCGKSSASTATFSSSSPSILRDGYPVKPHRDYAEAQDDLPSATPMAQQGQSSEVGTGFQSLTERESVQRVPRSDSLTLEQCEKWLNDKELRCVARLLLSKTEEEDFFGRLKDVTDTLKSQSGSTGTSCATDDIPGLATLEEQPSLSTTDGYLPPMGNDGPEDTANERFTGLQSPVSPVEKGSEQSETPTTFSRVGCVDAAPPLLDCIDKMDSFADFFRGPEKTLHKQQCLSHITSRTVPEDLVDGKDIGGGPRGDKEEAYAMLPDDSMHNLDNVKIEKMLKTTFEISPEDLHVNECLEWNGIEVPENQSDSSV